MAEITRDRHYPEYGIHWVYVTTGTTSAEERQASVLALGEARRWARELGKTTNGVVSSGAACKSGEIEYHFCFTFH
jgi:hypothetical protein